MLSDPVLGASARVRSRPWSRSCCLAAGLTLRHRAGPRCRHLGTPTPCSLTSPSTSPRRGCARRRRPRSGPPAATHLRCSRRARGARVHRHRRAPQRRPERRQMPAQRRMPHRRGVRRRLRLGPQAPQQRPLHPQLPHANRHLPPPHLHRPRHLRPAPQQLLQLRRLRLPHPPEASRRAPTRTPTGASRSPHSLETAIGKPRSKRAQALPASTWTSPMRT